MVGFSSLMLLNLQGWAFHPVSDLLYFIMNSSGAALYDAKKLAIEKNPAKGIFSHLLEAYVCLF